MMITCPYGLIFRYKLVYRNHVLVLYDNVDLKWEKVWALADKPFARLEYAYEKLNGLRDH